MTLCRLIAAAWAMDKNPNMQRVLEGYFNDDQIAEYNIQGYNIYFLPNSPLHYDASTPVTGAHIDQFNWVFCDMDLKDKVYPSKDAFLSKLADIGIPATQIVDSGGGIHAYWKASNLDAMSYLRFQRRLIRLLNTDEAVGQLFQLMRLPGSLNVKLEDNFRQCEYLKDQGPEYSAEELDKLLPPITVADEAYCEQHYNKTYGINQTQSIISDILPASFGRLLSNSAEVKSLWAGSTRDRSKSDFRLAHLMYANDFTRAEALSVLVNSAKALQRAPIHRASYAQNIVDKIWTFEAAPDKTSVDLSPTVRDILSKSETSVKGTRFPCHKLVDDTVHGFRRGQVIGIIGGSGVGKTTLTLNKFLWFAANNPDFHHFFYSLEQPIGEIAARIKTICGDNETLFDKIHVVSNYGPEGEYIHYSLQMIQDHIKNYETQSGNKVGAVVIDHIGVLDKSDRQGESEGLIGVCRQMKAVAVNADVMLIMLSQAPREKAGIGDIELDKSAAYGTVFFESFVDYCLCLWQPLKRCYDKGAPTVMAFKFAKIRHKKQGQDRIKEDVCYQLFFDPETERLRELTQDEEVSAKYWVTQATNARKADKKTDIVTYTSRREQEEETNGKILSPLRNHAVANKLQ